MKVQRTNTSGVHVAVSINTYVNQFKAKYGYMPKGHDLLDATRKCWCANTEDKENLLSQVTPETPGTITAFYKGEKQGCWYITDWKMARRIDRFTGKRKAREMGVEFTLGKKLYSGAPMWEYKNMPQVAIVVEEVKMVEK
jgi:hypothetical protein